MTSTNNPSILRDDFGTSKSQVLLGGADDQDQINKDMALSFKQKKDAINRKMRMKCIKTTVIFGIMIGLVLMAFFPHLLSNIVAFFVAEIEGEENGK